MTKAEKKVVGFVSRHILVFGFIAVSVVAFMVRYSFFDQRSGDWQIYLAKWIDQLKEHPGLKGIGEDIGEYNVPYMLFLNIAAKTSFNDLYEVKLFSIVFDYLLAAAGAVLVYRNSTRKASGISLAVYGSILLAPVAYIDSAWWSQCDSIFTFGIVMSLYFLTKEKYCSCWFWYGIAIAFKLQAVFFLPVLLIYYFTSKKMSILNVLIAAGTYVFMVSPAVIAGRGIKDTFSIYVKQTGLYSQLTLNMPNIHNIIPGDTIDYFRPASIYLTAGVLGIAACLFIKRGYHTPYAYVTLTLWTLNVCVFLLPAMHERYIYPACIVSIIWAALGRNKWDIAIAAAINAASIRAWMVFMFNPGVNKVYIAFIYLVIIVILTGRLFSLKEEPAEEEAPAEKEETPADKKEAPAEITDAPAEENTSDEAKIVAEAVTAAE